MAALLVYRCISSSFYGDLCKWSNLLVMLLVCVELPLLPKYANTFMYLWLLQFILDKINHKKGYENAIPKRMKC